MCLEQPGNAKMQKQRKRIMPCVQTTIYLWLEGVQSWLRSLIKASAEVGRDSEVGRESEEPGRTCRRRDCKF